MSQYISYIYYGASPLYDNYLNIYNAEDGAEVYSGFYYEGSYATDGNCVAVDQEGNTYIVGRYSDKLRKIDKDGVLLVEVDIVYPMQVAMSPDGSLYIYEVDNDGHYYVRKRSPVTLEKLDEFTVDDYGGDYHGMAFDSDGHLYMFDHSNDRLEKWNVTTKARLGTCDFSGVPNYFWGFICSIGIVGTKVLLVAWASASRFYETDTSLSAVSYYDGDPLPGVDNEALLLASLNNEYFILIGDLYGEYQDRVLFKLNPDLSTVWQVTVPLVELSLGAYTYRAVVYDFPLAPVMFPVKTQRSTISEKCKNFEKSMSDVCLVVNHNTRVTREYLQTTYEGSDYSESSNLRFVLPSQQLIRLLNKDLVAEDFKAIINNFISNISDIFILINENNTLMKQWLDDYEPDEAGHEFTDVKMKPIVIGDDLSKAMDDLFGGIEDNVTILNANLEVLKERF